MLRDRSRELWFHAASRTAFSRPTTDLYFVNALGNLIKGVISRGPIHPIGINSFRVRDVGVVLRQDSEATIREVLRRRWRKLIYVVDDDIEAGLHDQHLDARYRSRLENQYRRVYLPLVHAADHIVTSSKVLANRLSRYAETSSIDPYWLHGWRALARQSVKRKAYVRMVYLGAISHAADLRSILPAIEQVLSSHPEVEFTSFLDLPELRSMSKRHRVIIKPMRTWHRYRRWVGSEQFDLALYPMLDTPFNQARSVNKLIEHTIVGAVGVYSPHWHQSAYIEDGCNGYLADAGVGDWSQTLDKVIQARECLPDVFEAARGLAGRLNNQQRR